MRQFICRQRPSDQWFDAECRNAKRRTRRLERAYAAVNCTAASTTLMSKPSIDAAAAISKAAATKAAWYAQRRAYRQLRHRKSTDFWRDKVASNKSDPRQLWSIVDDLLGRGRVPASSAIDVETFSRYFEEKVAKVRSGTSDAPPPTFHQGRSDVFASIFAVNDRRRHQWNPTTA